MRALRRVNNDVYLDPDLAQPNLSQVQALIAPTRVLIGEADVGVAQGRIEHEGVLGHQFVGVVESCDDDAWVGKRVVGNIHISDTSSQLARRGLGNHDPQRLVLGLRGRDGCLAERFVLESRNLCALPDTINDEQGVLAFALSRAIHAGQVAHIEGRPFVSVLGDGLVGLLCAQVMTRLNASVRLLSSQEDRLELCAKWGIKHRHVDQVGRRHDQDVIIETTSTPEGFDDALRMVRPMGTIVLTGSPVPLNMERIPIDHELIADKEIRIIGSRCGSISEGVRAMGSGEIDLSGLITRRYKLDDAVSALRSAHEPANIGIVVGFD